MKSKPQPGGNQNTCVIKDAYPEYIKNSFDPVIKLQTEQIHHQGRYTDGK